MADRRYTTAELDAMEREAQSQGMNPDAAKSAADTMQTGSDFAEGASLALKRTLLGLQQAKEYLTGDDAAKEKVNAAIQALEANPSLGTTSGQIGNMAGTAAQFMGGSGAASAASRMLPRALVGISQKYIGKPGSVGRAAVQGAGYEATQPVTPPDMGVDEYALRKAGQMTAGAGAGAAGGAVANVLTREGISVPASRQGMMTEAKRLGVDRLITPAQKTGSPELQEYELGKRSQAGSAGLFSSRDREMQAALERKAASAIGSKEPAPTESVLAAQWEQALKGYKPMKSIQKMSIDVPYWDALKGIADDPVTKAASPTTVAMAEKILRATSKMNGNEFMQQLQRVRSLGFSAKKANDPAKADSFNDLATAMEDYAERRVGILSKQGKIAPDALDQLRTARAELSKIHTIESATDPTTGRVSADKYLTEERKRSPAHAGPSTSPTSKGLEDVGALSRIMSQIQVPGQGSGYGNLMAGRQIAATVENPSAPLKGLSMGKNYLTAKYYLAHGGDPSLLARNLTPQQNMMVRRLLPGMAFSVEEGFNQ